MVGSAVLFLLLDQGSKHLAQSAIVARRGRRITFLKLRCVRNHKRFYGATTVHIALTVLWAFALSSAAFLHLHGGWFQGSVALAGLGCAFGGAAGNLLDIVHRNCVVDFIDLGWWPVFNIADVGIVGGLALAFWR